MKVVRTANLVRVEFVDPATPDFNGAIVVTAEEFAAGVDAKMQERLDAFKANTAPADAAKVVAVEREELSSLKAQLPIITARLNDLQTKYPGG